MIANIVDRHTNSYDVRCDAIYEPSQHNNNVKGATQFTWGSEVFSIEEMIETTVVLAIERGQLWDCPVTLYLYDPGSAMSTTTDELDVGIGPG